MGLLVVITYLVTKQKSGRWWALEVPELDIFSQARRGRFEVKSMSRDLIACWLDIPQDSFKIVIVKI
jgi:hypothetical protein